LTAFLQSNKISRHSPFCWETPRRTMKGKLFTRRRLLGLGAGAVAAGSGALAYTHFLEPFWLEFVRRKLVIENLPAALKGKTLVQISDLHVSGRVSSDFLIESLRRVDELQPDIVVYTGGRGAHPAAGRAESLHQPRVRLSPPSPLQRAAGSDGV